MNRRTFLFTLAALIVISAFILPVRGDYPKPSVYPISWELTLDHTKPKRFVVNVPGETNPVAVWYVTYHVTNKTDRDKILFYPKWEMMTADGSIIRSDRNLAPSIFEAIKDREHMQYLVDANHIGGEIRQGEDQSKDGVAIWIEPQQRMGTFSIFATGFWGETVTVKEGDKDVPLHKTLQLTYHVNGDDGAVTGDEASEYVMR